MHRAATVLMIVVVCLSGVGTAAADDDPAGDTQEIIYQFDDSTLELVAVEFDDSTAEITLQADEPESASVGELADDTGSFGFESVRVSPGEQLTVEIPISEEQIFVASEGDAYTYEGDTGITILTEQPTTQLVQLAAASGILGSILALGLVVGNLRRKHHNNWTELFSEKKIEIESDPVEGVRERVIRGAKSAADSRSKVFVWFVASLYVLATLVGYAPTPPEMWSALSDLQRLLVAGSIAATVLALIPVYILVNRVYDPHREWIIDLDASEVIDAAQNGTGSIAAYSGPPERIEELEVDGGIVSLMTPGGRAHLVRDFDPQSNTANGTWPGLANDRELAIEKGKIDANREILKDEAMIGRDLLTAMSAIEIASETAAVRDVDKVLRDQMTVDASTMDEVLTEIAQGTRYEEHYEQEPSKDDLDFDGIDQPNQQTAATDGGNYGASN
ncbi:hypothetical protein K0C01_05015 [Salinarchaeum sp. IM2453]|uniref:hypothetical protein n=1 Tax=Salinarchaeum sp. IM2453 TaxID=2862870 RepID=UPI001C8368B0|nr:hypothetical protein [Salinarchaeum sp. IM2453]QZA89498.1 hypothetical protein K0C01_05015 [Salinarchaeum sp. IM2453]